jgi:hypothetical protein
LQELTHSSPVLALAHARHDKHRQIRARQPPKNGGRPSPLHPPFPLPHHCHKGRRACRSGRPRGQAACPGRLRTRVLGFPGGGGVLGRPAGAPEPAPPFKYPLGAPLRGGGGNAAPLCTRNGRAHSPGNLHRGDRRTGAGRACLGGTSGGGGRGGGMGRRGLHLLGGPLALRVWSISYLLKARREFTRRFDSLTLKSIAPSLTNQHTGRDGSLPARRPGTRGVRRDCPPLRGGRDTRKELQRAGGAQFCLC